MPDAIIQAPERTYSGLATVLVGMLGIAVFVAGIIVLEIIFL